MTKKTKAHEESVLTSLDDLRPAEYNPRKINGEALRGLRNSLERFGDLSGIVWNKRSGALVSGHQRVRALREEYGAALQIEHEGDNAWVQAPDGQRFRVRVVDWDDQTERLANLTANNPAIAGEFTADVADMIEDLQMQAPDLVDELRIYSIQSPADETDMLGAAGAGTDNYGDPIPEMELQPFEHYDYVLVVARNVQDWEWLCDRLEIHKVNSSVVAGQRKIGLGRAIDARRLISLMENRDRPTAKKPKFDEFSAYEPQAEVPF